MKVYSLTDRVHIKIGEVVVAISPLSFKQKMEIQAEMIKFESEKDVNALMEGSFKALKYAVKGVEGLTGSKGKYELSFEDGVLADNCVEELMNIEIGQTLTSICIGLINGVPREIINPMTKKPLEGVKIINPRKKGK